MYIGFVMIIGLCFLFFFFLFQAEEGIRSLVRSRGLGEVYKRQVMHQLTAFNSAGHANNGGQVLQIKLYEGRGIFSPVPYTHLTLPTLHSV